MHRAVVGRAAAADVVVMAAAVADFRPVVVADHKIKKGEGVPEVRLEPTVDILAALGTSRRPGLTLVGFAAETRDLVPAATDKLRRKGADLIVANHVSETDAGFEHDTNRVVLVSRSGMHHDVPLSDKRTIAREVIDAVAALRRGDVVGAPTPIRTDPPPSKETNP